MLAKTNLRILCSRFVKFRLNTLCCHSFDIPVNRLVDEQTRMRIIMKWMGACQATRWSNVFIVAHQRLHFIPFPCHPQRLADRPVGFGARHDRITTAVRSHLTRVQMNWFVWLNLEGMDVAVKERRRKKQKGAGVGDTEWTNEVRKSQSPPTSATSSNKTAGPVRSRKIQQTRLNKRGKDSASSMLF